MNCRVACVIEPEVSQLIGAAVQRWSVIDSGLADSWHLTVVNRGDATRRIVSAAERAGISVRTAEPDHVNAYSNKWLFLQAWPELSEQSLVLCLDWDIVQVREARVPEVPEGNVGCRRNPPDMYAEVIRGLHGRPGCSWANGDGRISTSVNGGVIVGTQAVLARMCGLVGRYLRSDVFQRMKHHAWAREQLALSVAAGDIGLVPLGDEWNVTPLSPVPAEHTVFWHYNDGHPVSRRLKQSLADPVQVRELCMQLPDTHRRSVNRFLQLYELVSFSSVLNPGR